MCTRATGLRRFYQPRDKHIQAAKTHSHLLVEAEGKRLRCVCIRGPPPVTHLQGIVCLLIIQVAVCSGTQQEKGKA